MKKTILILIAFVFSSYISNGQSTTVSNQLSGTLPSSPTQYLGSSNAADVIFKTNNVERMRILSTGCNVGIGTTSPTGVLQIHNPSLSSYIHITNGSVGQGVSDGVYIGQLAYTTLFKLQEANADYTCFEFKNINNDLLFRINSLGNVGIGTFNTSSKFQINGNAVIGYSSAVSAPTNGLCVGGDVGIGTTNPTDKFQIGENVESISFGSALNIEAGYLYGYQGFNARRAKTGANISSSWALSNDGGNSGGAVIGVTAIGDIVFIPVKTSGQSQSLSDADLKKRKVVHIGAGTISEDGDLVNAYMFVNGNITCEELIVKEFGEWWDNVFETDYKQMSLPELEQYININKHLPDVPSADEVKKDGVALGEFNGVLLKKIEELTLYVIEINKQIEALKKENDLLKR